MSMKLKYFKDVPVAATLGVRVYMNDRLIYNSYPSDTLDIENIEYLYWDHVIQNIASIAGYLIINISDK